ncbi:MAG TPA: DUF1254 domain-containing protein [Thermoanaerobaculia bacterium]|nr:DUF1254 domain-containing protein [Thermoanaerobaculia bacterium]
MPTLKPEEARQIAKEAYVYGFPLVDNYRVNHSFFVDGKGPEFKAPWNTLNNTARVFTPDDTAIQTPNSDTPYSQLGTDLRAEPLVLTIPPIEKGRYFSVQLIDLYTHNYDYIGTRTTGNGGGHYLLAGPGWKGEVPAGIAATFRCETELGWAFYRTQLFDPSDIEGVKKVQAGYQVQTLSQFLGKPPPPPAPRIDFIRPLTADEQRTSPDFFKVLAFVLGFCPTHPSEVALRERFARLGIEGGKPFDPAKLPPVILQAVKDGMADAWAEFAAHKARDIDTGKIGSADVFGTREYLGNNYAYRMAGAVLGIYGNSKEEAVYPIYFVDTEGEPLDASRKGYALRFPPGGLPPVGAFWSLTLYALPSKNLYANPLKRYLVNSPMLPGLARDADGGLTLHVQHASPGAGKESNWLPAPKGPFFMALRLYLPRKEALDGTWKRPEARGTPIQGGK